MLELQNINGSNYGCYFLASSANSGKSGRPCLGCKKWDSFEQEFMPPLIAEEAVALRHSSAVSWSASLWHREPSTGHGLCRLGFQWVPGWEADLQEIFWVGRSSFAAGTGSTHSIVSGLIRAVSNSPSCMQCSASKTSLKMIICSKDVVLSYILCLLTSL